MRRRGPAVRGFMVAEGRDPRPYGLAHGKTREGMMAFKTCLFWVVSALAFLPTVLPQAAAAQQWRREPVTVGPAGGSAALAVVDLRGGGQMQVLCQGEEFSVSVRLPFRIEDAAAAAVTLTVPGRTPRSCGCGQIIPRSGGLA